MVGITCRHTRHLFLRMVVSAPVERAVALCGSLRGFQSLIFLTVAVTYVSTSVTKTLEIAMPPENNGRRREIWETIRHCYNRLRVYRVLFYSHWTLPEFVKLIPVLAKNVLSRIKRFTTCLHKINHCGVGNMVGCRGPLTSGHRWPLFVVLLSIVLADLKTKLYCVKPKLNRKEEKQVHQHATKRPINELKCNERYVSMKRLSMNRR